MIILLFSLYLSGVEIEGDFILDSLTREQFTHEFSNKEVSLTKVLDSLFFIYEERGFFNVKFDINIDTIRYDTASLKIKILNTRLPVIKTVKTEGIKLPSATLYTYFPFRMEVFKRSTVINSFIIFRNARIISNAEYRFIPLNDKNTFALKLIFRPYEEVFSINLTGDRQKGISGNVSLAYPSILGSGAGVNISADFKERELLSYELHGLFLLPWLKGVILNGYAINVSDTSSIIARSMTIAWWGRNSGFKIRAGKIQSTFYWGVESMYYANRWKSEFEVRRGSGWIFSNFMAFKSKLEIGAEHGIVLSSVPHYFMMNKPMRTFRKSLSPHRLHSFHLIRSRLPLVNSIFVFLDAGHLDNAYFGTVGLAYIKRRYGIYLGLSGGEDNRKINIGFVFGARNSLFERSIRIL